MAELINNYNEGFDKMRRLTGLIEVESVPEVGLAAIGLRDSLNEVHGKIQSPEAEYEPSFDAFSQSLDSYAEALRKRFGPDGAVHK